MSHTKSTISIESTLADPAWCNQKYNVEMLGCPDIGRLVERDAKTVWAWLRKHGIQTRARGTDERQQYKPGHDAPKGWHHTPESIEKIGKASRDRGAVPYRNKDGVHYLTGKSPEENPHWKGGITPERQRFYHSDEWQAASKFVWQRDGGTCQRCGLNECEPMGNGRIRKLSIHHIAPFGNEELRAAPSNLVLLCTKCHRWVHGKANTERMFIAEVTA